MAVKAFAMDGGANLDSPSHTVPANQWTSLTGFNFGRAHSATHGLATRAEGNAAGATLPNHGVEPQWAMQPDVIITTRTPTEYLWYGGIA